MALLSTIYPYILREYAMINNVDIDNVDQDELFDSLNKDWEGPEGWAEFCTPYIKAIDNFKRVDFSEVRKIVLNRLIDNESYIKLLEKYNLNNNNIQDSNGNELLYEDLKIQLLAKIFNKEIIHKDAIELGYTKYSQKENSNEAIDDLVLADDEPLKQEDVKTIFNVNISDKPLNLQINDVNFKMSARDKFIAVNKIAHCFMGYIERYAKYFDSKVNEYASKNNVSTLRAKWEISRKNDSLKTRIKRELALKEPQMKYVSNWQKQIIPLNEEDVVNLYSAKNIANEVYKFFKSDPKYSIISENFDSLLIEAASIVNKVYGINMLGNTELYDSFTNGENIDDPSESNVNEDAPKSDYSHADDRTKASEASLTRKVKRAYTKCYNTDSYGDNIPIDISTAHNKVLHLTEGMIDKDDLIPMLSKSKEQWIGQFIKMLKDDEDLFKQLYRCIKLYAQDYRIIYFDRKSKTFKQKSINIDDKSNLLKSETQANIDNGLIQGDRGFSLYNEKGYIDKQNIQNLVNFIKDIRKDVTALDDNELYTRIVEVFKDLGITVPVDFNLYESISVRITEKTTREDIINDLVKQFLQITDSAFKATKDKDNIPLRADDDSSYKWIYNFISASAIGYTESVTNEQGESYYTYSKTNYFDELILKIKRSVLGKKTKSGKDYYEDFINNQFKASEFFYDSINKEWRSDWMSKLFDNTAAGNKYREIFNRCSLLYTNHTKYLDWDRNTALRSSFLMYRQGEDFTLPEKGIRAAWYRMPIASDSPAGDYIRFISYTGDDYEDKIYNKLWSLCKQELVRMNDVSEHLKKVQDGSSTVDSIKSYDAKIKNNKLVDAGGLIFTLMPQLNYIKIDPSKYDIFKNIPMKEDFVNGNFVDIIRDLEHNKSVYGLTEEELKNFFKSVYQEWFNNDFSTEYAKVASLVESVMKKETVENRRNAWKNFSLNTQFAFTQIVQLTSTDMAFFGKRKVVESNKENSNFSYNGKYYKIVSDDALDVFQKRNKEYHAPTNKIATDKKFYREVYLNDIEIKSQILENVKAIVKKNKELSAQEKNHIIEMYEKAVTVADGQAYRSLSSYKEMLKDFGELTKDQEEAFDRIIKTHEWDLGDLNLITLAIKPYMYAVIPTQRDTERLDGNQNMIPVPTQHKNSEYPLLAALGAISAELNNSAQLKALSRFTEKHNIDVLQFNSAVKVGEIGTTNIDWTVDDENKIIEDLEKYCGFDINSDGISTRVHNIPTEHWGEQQKKPEHLIDKQQLVGSQPRRLILADIPDTDEDGKPYTIVVNGKAYTKSAFVEHYQELITQNLLEDFHKVDDMFKDPQKLSEFLREQVASSNKYDTDMMEMFTWDAEKGRFNIPFWDQSIANRVEELLNGLIRNRIAKQKMRGGSAVQTADVGLTKKLNVRYQDEHGNLKITYDEFKSQYPDKTKDDYHDYLGNSRLAYMECLLPMWSKDIMEALTSENGYIDFNRLPESLREMIGYRIPTEDHYSMAPLKVVGFMPTMGASSIMLPADITKIAGSDFDVDVMYLLIKEFNVNKIDMKSAISAYNKQARQNDRIGDTSVDKLLLDIFKNNELIDDILSTEIPEKSRRFAVWLNRHEEEFYLEKKDWTISPVEYDMSKTEKQNSRKARNNEIIDCMYACLTSPHSIEKFSNPGNYEPQKRASRINECLKLRKDKSVKTILNASIPELEEMIAQAKNSKNIGSPVTAVDLHQQNAVGVALKGIFAAANATQQLFEYAKVQANLHFTINWNNSNRDNEQWQIGRLRNKNGNLITKNLAGYLAAAVDNGKDPIMNELAINSDNAKIVVYLTLLGYEPLEISLFMNCVNRCHVDEDFLDSYNLNKEESALDIEQMAWAIQNFDTDKGQAICARAKQMMRAIDKGASILNMFTRLMRADSVSSNVGKSMFDNILKTIQYNNADYLNTGKDFYVFSQIGDATKSPKWPILPYETYKLSNIYDHIKESNIPYLQAFIDTTIRASYNWIGEYSLLNNDIIYHRISRLANSFTGYLNEGLVNRYLSDLEVYYLNNLPLFGKEQGLSTAEKRKYYAEQFPQEFAKFKKNLPKELKGNIFIDNIIIAGADKNVDPYAHLEVKDLGISKSIRDQFKLDFIKLATVNHEIAQKLFVYTVYRDGLRYSQKGFAHLIPARFKKAIPGYIDAIYNVKSISNDEDFYDQFVRNNYKEFPQLAPPISFSTKKEEESMMSREIFDISGYPITSGYITIGESLYKKVLHEGANNAREDYKIIKVQTLGIGSIYHEYDYNGGVNTLPNSTDVNPDINEYSSQELDSFKEGINKLYEDSEQNQIEDSEQKTDKVKIPESNNTTDDAGNKQC